MDIKKAIKESGFTISKVAEKLGIAQPSLTAQLIMVQCLYHAQKRLPI